MNKYEDMERVELQEMLGQLQEELEELEEEKGFVLGQTGLHLPGSTVKKYETEIEQLKQQITMVEAALTTR